MNLFSIFAANEIVADGEWLRISPYGEFPNTILRRGRPEAGVQVVERSDADNLVTAFNSFSAQLGRAFRGAPIYVGHPDVPDATEAARHTDKRRYGSIRALEARADGLYGQVVWNDLGQAAIDQGHYQFSSPFWALADDPNRQRAVRPIRLLSVGLTNSPAIPNDPWAKNEDSPNPVTNPETMLIQKLIEAGLVGEGATEEELAAALDALIAAANAAAEKQQEPPPEMAAANERITQLETDLTAANERADIERQSRVEAILAQATAEGRITAHEVAGWNTRFATDFEGAHTALQSLGKGAASPPQGGPAVVAPPKEAGSLTPNMVAINNAVQSYAKAQGLDLSTHQDYNTAFAAVRRSLPTLFSK